MIKSQYNKKALLYFFIIFLISAKPIFTTSLSKRVLDLGKKTLQMGSALAVGVALKNVTNHYFNFLEKEITQEKNAQLLNEYTYKCRRTIDNDHARKNIIHYFINNSIILQDEILVKCMIEFYKKNNFNIDLTDKYAKKYIELMFFNKTESKLYTDQCFVDVINEMLKKKSIEMETNKKQSDKMKIAKNTALKKYIIYSLKIKKIEQKLKEIFIHKAKTKILNFTVLFNELKFIVNNSLVDETNNLILLFPDEYDKYKDETKILKKEIKNYIKTPKEINTISEKKIFNNSINTIKPISTTFHEMGHVLFSMLYHENRGQIQLLAIPLLKMTMQLYNRINEQKKILKLLKNGMTGFVHTSKIEIIENHFKQSLAGYFSVYILDTIINNKNRLDTLLFNTKANDGDMLDIKKILQKKEYIFFGKKKYDEEWVQKMIQETFDTLISVRSAQILYTLYIWNGEHQDPHNKLPKIYTQKHENNIEYDLEKTIYFNKNFNPFLNANDLDYLIQSTNKMIDNYQKRSASLTIQEKQVLALAKYALKFENLKDSYTFVTNNQHLQDKSFKEKLSDLAFDFLA